MSESYTEAIDVPPPSERELHLQTMVEDFLSEHADDVPWHGLIHHRFVADTAAELAVGHGVDVEMARTTG